MFSSGEKSLFGLIFALCSGLGCSPSIPAALGWCEKENFCPSVVDWPGFGISLGDGGGSPPPPRCIPVEKWRLCGIAAGVLVFRRDTYCFRETEIEKSNNTPPDIRMGAIVPIFDKSVKLPPTHARRNAAPLHVKTLIISRPASKKAQRKRFVIMECP